MKFISITKPGIIFGNLVTLFGGYFLGLHSSFHFQHFFSTFLAMMLVIASGCVFNNYIDRDIDKLMDRTKNRVLVIGTISGKVALLYGSLLGLTGFLILYLKTNLLAFWIALFGFFVYVVVYSLWLKRRVIYGALIGGIAGAVPPVAGYCAAANQFNLGAILLFFILFLWQMPHFYAIAIYRMKDFAAANLPILPIRKSIDYTKKCMLGYIILLMMVSVMPTIFNYTGIIYLIIAILLGVYWLGLGVKNFNNQDDKNNQKWSRKMFVFSIIYITFLSIALAVRF